MIKKIKIFYKNIPQKVIDSSLFVIIAIIAVSLRFYKIGKLSFWLDEASSFNVSLVSLKAMFKIDSNMSFFHLITHYFLKIFPTATDEMLRSISAIFSLASIPVVFLLGKTIETDKKKSIDLGLIAALLVTINAYHIQYAQEFRSYSLVFFLSSLSTYFLIKAISQSYVLSKSSNKWWLFYILTSVTAIYSHFYAVFIFFSQVVSLLVLFVKSKKKFPFKKVIGCVVAIALLITPVIITVLTKGSGQIAWIIKPSPLSVKDFAYKITGNQGILLFILSIVTLSIGLMVKIKTWSKNNILTKWNFVLILCCLFFPIVLSLVFSEIFVPIFVDRYLLLIMPYSTIFISTGIINLPTLVENKLKFKVFVILATTIITALIVILSFQGIDIYFTKSKKEDWRSVSQFITLNCPDTNNLRIYYQFFIENATIRYNLNLKSQIAYISKNAIYNFPEYGRVCLTLSHVNKSKLKEQNEIQNIIKSKFPNVESTKFYGAEVQVYKR